jgi:hypothetical protein
MPSKVCDIRDQLRRGDRRGSPQVGSEKEASDERSAKYVRPGGALTPVDALVSFQLGASTHKSPAS